ncbi:MAG: nitronate monooxygenase family protein [Candidatus Neomarinimicrobiota bacterium]
MSEIFKMPELRIGELVARLQIIQGGMGVGVSLAGLATAVAHAGGIGVISAIGLGLGQPQLDTDLATANERALKQEICKARSISDGIVGVNIMVALSDYETLVDCAVAESADILFLGAGLPLRFSPHLPPDRLRGVPTRFAPIVSSDRAARIIFQHWDRKFGRIPDAVVVEGPLAGGHLGFTKAALSDPAQALERLVPAITATVADFEQRYGQAVPVIAAGGIFDGGDIYRFIELGAAGVQMGTRFVATRECDAHDNFKQSYLEAKPEDIMIIESPVGLPGRAIRNSFLTEVAAGEKKPFKCSWKCLRTCDLEKAPYCIASALINARKGNLRHGFTFAGANVHRVAEIIPVADLMNTLAVEYKLAARLRACA